MGRAERAEGVTAGALNALHAHGRPAALAGDRLLPVRPDLAGLCPGGLLRGSTMAVSGRCSGATSLALGLLAAPSAAGSWCSVVGLPDLGLLAVAEAGLDLARVALVPNVPPDQWVVAVGALVDAVDAVLVGPPSHVRIGDARRLSARARERGTVLMVLGRWAERVDLQLTVEESRWEGLDAGHGHLAARRLVILTNGRGAAARPRRVMWWTDGHRRPAARFAGSDVEAGSADAGMLDHDEAMAAGAGMPDHDEVMAASAG